MLYYMQKRSSKKRMDLNALAANIVSQATDELSVENPPADTKNPAAVALGRLGGLKGGKIRALKLSPQRRQQIARTAAQKRWQKRLK
jgi:hypothetical protein